MRVFGLIALMISVALLAILWADTNEPLLGPGENGQPQYEESIKAAEQASDILEQ